MMARITFSIASVFVAIFVSLLISTEASGQKGTIIANTIENPVRVKSVDNPALQR